MSKKKFDCVELMRSIRDKHRVKYENDPELREKRLLEIHKKFGFATQVKLHASR